LAKAGKMMLNQKCAVITERLGFDIVLDKIAEPLARIGVGTGAARLGAAEQSKFHLLSSGLVIAGSA
jgi:hypothetical protein